MYRWRFSFGQDLPFSNPVAFQTCDQNLSMHNGERYVDGMTSVPHILSNGTVTESSRIQRFISVCLVSEIQKDGPMANGLHVYQMTMRTSM
jgi:hypothetical protein